MIQCYKYCALWVKRTIIVLFMMTIVSCLSSNSNQSNSQMETLASDTEIDDEINYAFEAPFPDQYKNTFHSSYTNRDYDIRSITIDNLSLEINDLGQSITIFGLSTFYQNLIAFQKKYAEWSQLAIENGIKNYSKHFDESPVRLLYLYDFNTGVNPYGVDIYLDSVVIEEYIFPTFLVLNDGTPAIALTISEIRRFPRFATGRKMTFYHDIITLSHEDFNDLIEKIDPRIINGFHAARERHKKQIEDLFK